MWFGWGNKHKAWDLGDGYTLLCTYQYFHIFWVLGITSGKKWHLQGEKRSEDRELTKDEVSQIFHGAPPKVGYYRR